MVKKLETGNFFVVRARAGRFTAQFSALVGLSCRAEQPASMGVLTKSRPSQALEVPDLRRDWISAACPDSSVLLECPSSISPACCFYLISVIYFLSLTTFQLCFPNTVVKRPSSMREAFPITGTTQSGLASVLTAFISSLVRTICSTTL